MPHLNFRDEEHSTRKKRLSKLRRGSGVFVYDGSIEDTQSIPTPLLTGDKELVYNGATGSPLTDAAGRPVYKPAGKPVTDYGGRLVMGGMPIIKRSKISTINIQGSLFPAGEQVVVDDATLALKLRGMPGFSEVLPESEAPQKRRKKADEAS